MADQIMIEVCVDSVASAIAAERGGAGRIELCSDLLEGGITPSAGLIEQTRALTSVALHVIIRPRGGDFCYTTEEFETMRRDIVAVKKQRVDGVVFGVLDPKGDVDTQRTQQLIEMARPLKVTFHRAFDMSANLFRALEDICMTGADRLLTSGGEPTCFEGVHTIAKLVQAARDRIAIMAAGSISDHNAQSIVDKTGVREIHVGLRTSVASPMLHRNPRIALGTADGREYQRFQVLEESVRSLRRAVSPKARADDR